jgi:hypothetical protein
MNFLKKLLNILDESIKDNATGQYSHSRIISMLIALGATMFMWKLILMGGMTIEYFIAYLAYGTSHQTLNKFLDNKDPQRSIIVAADDYKNLPKPPKD